ncbi:MAG: hypothetical protein JNL98_07050 [Bryobacterales bacterium]|nr:hypothetical protein [Bryobacterales bacterium]
MRHLLFMTLLIQQAQAQQEGWWMREPIRWVQTNLRETDARIDPRVIVDQVAAFRANVLHINIGGITAFYPTRLDLQTISPHLPQSRDLIGEAVAEAHRRHIRVVGRFDLSKTAKPAYDAHPEWYFRKANGDPVIYNGLYSTCINGGYYADYGMRILTEALERYELDGLFFNMFGNQSRDYSGNFVGHCHCDACKRKYRTMFGKDLPKEPDEEYRQFLYRSSREVAARIGQLIRAKRPNAGYFNYIQEWTDGIMSESNTAVSRPLPLWPYTSSDNVNRARNSEPGKMSVNLCMQFLDYAWRFATVPAHEITLRLWQNVAHGGAAAFAVNGTLDHEDRQAIEAARPVFGWLAENEQYYSRQQNIARVLLLGAAQGSGRGYSTNSYRGLFRFLSEEHIPFAVADNLQWMGKRKFDLVIAADWAPPELDDYARQGGKVLVVSSRVPEFSVARTGKVWPKTDTYVRVRDRTMFPSLKNTNLLMLEGEFVETEGDGAQSMSLVPPSMFGPPEKIHVDMKDSEIPAVAMTQRGMGKVVWVPWNLGALYYRYSLPAHALMLRDLVAHLRPERQLKTDAHPLVEMTLMRQGSRTLIHLINLSGHSQTGYFAPVPMSGIGIDVEASASRARAVRSGVPVPLRRIGGRVEFTVPKLSDYELIVLE